MKTRKMVVMALTMMVLLVTSANAELKKKDVNVYISDAIVKVTPPNVMKLSVKTDRNMLFNLYRPVFKEAERVDVYEDASYESGLKRNISIVKVDDKYYYTEVIARFDNQILKDETKVMNPVEITEVYAGLKNFTKY